MKLKGKKIEGPNVDYVVIPRPDGDIAFTVKAVLDDDAFEKLCPKPEPPMILMAGQKVASKNVEDPEYKEALKKHASLYSDWMIMKALEETEGLEWETVKPDQPETWGNLRDELKASGFSSVEISRIYAGIITVNGLNESTIEQARKRFLATKQARA